MPKPTHSQGLSMELEDAQELAAAQPRLLLAGMEQLAQRLRCLSQLLMWVGCAVLCMASRLYCKCTAAWVSDSCRCTLFQAPL